MEYEFFFPNIGSPGSASSNQVESIERLLKQKLPFPISDEQARLYLSARDYARGIALVRERENLRTTSDQILQMVAKITAENDLRDYVTTWAKSRWRRGTHNSDPRLRRDEFFARILSALD